MTLENFIKALEDVYDQREATTITQWLLEDKFRLYNIKDENLKDIHRGWLVDILPRLLAHEPWQYILGEADFYGEKWSVSSAVLIPRSETEELIYSIQETLNKETDLNILDIGTGSGCIAVSVQKISSSWSVLGLDISKDALALASENAQRIAPKTNFKEVDFLDESTWTELGSYDVIISNPPYITHKERGLMRTNVLSFEPDKALFVTNEDPQQFYKAIARFGQDYLRDNGHIFLELNEFFAQETKAIFERLGYTKVALIKDINGKDRVLHVLK